MENHISYKSKLKKWDTTLESYVDWVAKSDLRKYFSKEIKINNFSLWWVTAICNKDNMLKNKWYYDLKDCLTENKKIKFNKPKFYIIFAIKFIKNLITAFAWFFIIKLLSFSRYKKIKNQNCFHSFNYNFLKSGLHLIDRCYGKTPLKYYKNNFYIINIIKKKHFILNFFKKKKLGKKIRYVIADEYLSIVEVIYVYYKTIVYFFKLKFFLNKNKNKNFYYINGVNCQNVLEPLLLMSFAGEIQNSLFNSLSIKNFLKKNEVKLFITYCEFNPSIRSIYFFVRDINKPPKIISIQHGHSNKNLMFFFHKKNEFTKNQLLEGRYYSPSPDFYLTQGDQFNKILKNYFPRKTKIIGALKYDVSKFKKIKNNEKLNKIKFQNGKKNKRIVLLCPSIGDELDILNYLKHSVNFNFRFILSPHPSFRKKIIKKYFHELKNKCNLEVYNNISTLELLSISNLVICGFSTVAYEALFLGVQPIRIVNPNKPQFFDLGDKLPTATSPFKLKKILNKKIAFKTKQSRINKIKKDYFYKLDNKAYIRFWDFVKKNKN